MAALAVVNGRKQANSAVLKKGTLPRLPASAPSLPKPLLHAAGKALTLRCTAGLTSARGLLKQPEGRGHDYVPSCMIEDSL